MPAPPRDERVQAIVLAIRSDALVVGEPGDQFRGVPDLVRAVDADLAARIAEARES